MNASPVVLVTGAAKGIGKEVARLLVKRGATVILAARDGGKAEALAAGFRPGTTERVLAVSMDVTSDKSVAAAVDYVLKETGHLDVLINNAAVLLDRSGDIGTVPLEVLRDTLETNVLGAWRVTQAFLPLLEKSPAPRVINVSSGAGQLSEPGNWAPAYSVSKTALNGMTTQLAVARPHFAVNAVSPGWCRTEMGGSGAPRSAAEGADSIVWLAAAAPQSLTGSFIHDRRPMAW